MFKSSVTVNDILRGLSDTLQMVLTYEDRLYPQIFGTRTIERKLGLVELPLDLEVVDSVVDDLRDMGAVMVKISGNLNLIMITDLRLLKLTAMVVDSDRLISLIPDSLKVFRTYWDRKDLYEVILPGVKAVFSRGMYTSDPWRLSGTGASHLREYLERKNLEEKKNAEKYRKTTVRK